MDIGARLREAREQLGLSQTEFGRIGGVGKTTVLAWEHGTAFPNAAFLAAIAAMGADAGYIVTGQRGYSPPPPLSAEEQQLLDLWRPASRDTKNAVMGALTGGAGRARAKQVFHGTVGQVVRAKGDVSISGSTFDQRQPRSKKKP